MSTVRFWLKIAKIENTFLLIFTFCFYSFSLSLSLSLYFFQSFIIEICNCRYVTLQSESDPYPADKLSLLVEKYGTGKYKCHIDGCTSSPKFLIPRG